MQLVWQEAMKAKQATINVILNLSSTGEELLLENLCFFCSSSTAFVTHADLGESFNFRQKILLQVFLYQSDNQTSWFENTSVAPIRCSEGYENNLGGDNIC